MKRSRRSAPLQLLTRLLMAVLLLGGMAASPFAMAGGSHHAAAHAADWHAASSAPSNHHDCCMPQPAAEGCAQFCSAVTCAVPMLTGAQSLPGARIREGIWPVAVNILQGSGPELETPPPKRLIEM